MTVDSTLYYSQYDLDFHCFYQPFRKFLHIRGQIFVFMLRRTSKRQTIDLYLVEPFSFGHLEKSDNVWMLMIDISVLRMLLRALTGK